jgi:hypothetical protein
MTASDNADHKAAPPADRDYVEALARGLAVMKAFREQSDRLTLSDVARITDLSRASVRRSLLTLEALGYVESSGRYFSLSPQVLTLAQAYLSSSPVPRVAQSFLEKASGKRWANLLAVDPALNDEVYIALGEEAHWFPASRHRHASAGALHVDGPSVARGAARLRARLFSCQSQARELHALHDCRHRRVESSPRKGQAQQLFPGRSGTRDRSARARHPDPERIGPRHRRVEHKRARKFDKQETDAGRLPAGDARRGGEHAPVLVG